MNLGLIQGIGGREEGNGISLMSRQHNERTKQEGHCKRRGLHFRKWQVGNRKLV